MNKLFATIITLLIISICTVYSQKNKTDANIVGHVVSEEGHIPYASVYIKGTTIGTITDESGHYQLVNLPEGVHTIIAKMVGYKPQQMTIVARKNETLEHKFKLEKDVLRMEEVVVSANRAEQKRTEAPVIVNTISPELFQSSQCVTLGDGLNFSPGLRLENNCQNCGFTQVRMNGLEGPYSQILINSRPIVSGLAGVYGLELIPVSMIQKVEVVRGGGSALFGSNAIAGTINIILKEPVTNSYEAGASWSMTGAGMQGTGGIAPDYTINFNTSLVSDDHKSGISIYGFTRERDMFDANNDGFSEISPLKNLSMGSRMFYHLGDRSKLSLDFFSINEKRDGGNRQDYPLHQRDVAEALKHDLKTGVIAWEQYFRDYDLLTVYASGQYLERDSYYGANRSLADYGNSNDKTYNIGAQYKAVFGESSVITGFENTGSYLVDKKLGYPDYQNAVIRNDSILEVPHVGNTVVANQALLTSGAFIQYELKMDRTKIALGARFDHYEVRDLAREDSEPKFGDVFSPRISFMYKIFDQLQARLNYSQGYRAPQIFDEDLHVETSGSRQVINQNDPDLTQETSNSFMVSLDYNGPVGDIYTGFLIEGFYTRLEDPFVNDIGEVDENGIVLYTRRNAEEGATVKGINMEFKLRPSSSFSLTSGFTVQSSEYDIPQEFGEKRFFRTPGQYGYLALDWDFAERFCLSATGNFTGPMLVPHFGFDSISATEWDHYNIYLNEERILPEAEITKERLNEISEVETGNVIEGSRLERSEHFFDLGFKLKYALSFNKTDLEIFAGVKNLLNSYQSNFDKGISRDPSYIYGPLSPRTIYFGFRVGKF